MNKAILIFLILLLCSCNHRMSIWVKEKGQITITDSTMVIIGPAVIRPGR